VILLGGHSVRDPEIKFGYAVTGELDPKRIVTNAGAEAGDLLVLTKPIGTGFGLGLPICHGIVASHGGELSFETTTGQGTTFRVTPPTIRWSRRESRESFHASTT
jgi:thiamine monophosphate kinase